MQRETMNRTQLLNVFALAGALLLAAGLAGGWLMATLLPVAAPLTVTPLTAALLAVLILAIVLLAWRLHLFGRAYFRQVQELADLGRTLLVANPTLRVPPAARLASHPDILALRSVLDDLAVRFASLHQGRAEAIRQGRAEMEQERNLLAALMSELTEGVLACNLEGQILLYNRNARTLLTFADDEASMAEASGAYVGLGRSLFSVLDRQTIVHAIEQVEARRTRFPGADERTVVVSFVTTAANGLLLRARLAPFAGAEGSVRGYVLLLQDLSEGIERSMRRDRLLQTLTERTRGSVAAIRAASETIEHFPDMNEGQRIRLQAAILHEAQVLSIQLDETLRAHASDLRAQWRLEDIHGADLLWSLQRHLASNCSIQATIGALDEALWLKVDSYTLFRGLGQALGQAVELFGLAAVELRLLPAGSFAALDIDWPLPAAAVAAWDGWKRQVLAVDDSDGILSLRELADRHAGEVWVEWESARSGAAIHLLLPQTAEPLRPGAVDRSIGPSAEQVPSRPEYYDFDLFARGGSLPQTDRPLNELVYTVFDTETTGLLPDYDEIIAIGALRIVNGRILRGEVFEQLIDPRRSVPEAAVAVHGITDAMVAGQPPIERVLPRFHHFAHDTVLVGHNLAFDLRMFAAKEAAAGVRFEQPLLDTLLLSSIVHPHHASHSLEAIAERLGLTVIGRHTALGDALLTGEIFMHLLPLLAAQGIVTLRQAQVASQASYLSRLRY